MHSHFHNIYTTYQPHVQAREGTFPDGGYFLPNSLRSTGRKYTTVSVRQLSPRTSEDGTSSEPTLVQTVTARATEAIGHKHARHGQECNDNTTSPKGTASNNSEPLTRGDIPSLVQEIVNTPAERTGGPSLNGGATSGNKGSIPRGLAQECRRLGPYQ